MEPRAELETDGDAVAERRSQIQRDRKFWISMVLYGLLAVLVWFTLGEGTTEVLGRRIEIKWIPLFVLGTFVFRTYMAREADKIRRRSQ